MIGQLSSRSHRMAPEQLAIATELAHRHPITVEQRGRIEAALRDDVRPRSRHGFVTARTVCTVLNAAGASMFSFGSNRRFGDGFFFGSLAKRQMARHLENYFIEARFPPPNEYTLDLDDYLSSIVCNDELDCETRIRAAYENGTLNGMRTSRRYSLVMQLNSASKLALKRYAKLAARFQAT